MFISGARRHKRKVIARVTSRTGVVGLALGMASLAIGGVGLQAASGSSTTVYAGGAKSEPAAMTALYKQAKSNGENTVIVAVATEDDVAYTHMATMFEKAYPGITVQIRQMPFLQVGSVVQGQINSGIRTADIVTDALLELKPMISAGSLATNIPWTKYKVPTGTILPDGFLLQSEGACTSVVYNPKYVKASELPDSYAGFEASKWKNKTATLSDNGPACMGFYGIRYGENATLSLISKLVSNGFEFSANAQQLLISGERPVLLFHYSIEEPLDAQKGIKVAEKYLPGTGMFQTRAGIVKSSPVPNLARLFSLWLTSKTAENYYANFNGGGVGNPTVPGDPFGKHLKSLGLSATSSIFINETLKNYQERSTIVGAISAKYL